MDREKSSQVVRLGADAALSSSPQPCVASGEPALHAGDMVANKYEVLRLVAVGGMGAVYAVRHLDLGKDVALKIMGAGSGHKAHDVERFRREAKAAARMSSERIVRVYDVDRTAEGLSYLVMDLLEGQPLSRALEQGLVFSELRAASYVMQLCEALEEAHRHGVIHRDVKPANLMACGETFDAPGSGQEFAPVRLKLLDFGAAKFKDEGGTPPPEAPSEPGSFSGAQGRVDGGFTVFNDAMVPGTPAYMSPEQYMRPSEVTAAADIWAAGIVLFELVRGRPPFEARDVGALAEAIVLDPPPLHEIADTKLRAVIARCLEKEPGARFSSATELRGALAALWEETREPVAPTPTEVPVTLGTKGRGRRRALFAALVTAVGATAFWLASRAPASSPTATVEPRPAPPAMSPALRAEDAPRAVDPATEAALSSEDVAAPEEPLAPGPSPTAEGVRPAPKKLATEGRARGSEDTRTSQRQGPSRLPLF